MSRPTRQQLAPTRLEQVWEALARGFYPFQTMPGVSVTLSGDRERGIRYEVWECYPGPDLPHSTTVWLCSPEDCHKVLPAVWKALAGHRRTGLGSALNKYFKPL